MTASDFNRYFKRVRGRACKKEENATRIIYTDRFGNQAIQFKSPGPYNMSLYYNGKFYSLVRKNS